MELQIKTRNSHISERQRAYAQEKLGKLSRYLEGLQKATVELREEQRRNEGTVHRAQVTIAGERGLLLRAEHTNSDLHAAIDAVHDTLQRQITRHKDKLARKRRRANDDMDMIPIPDTHVGEEGEARIVRQKAFTVKPMTQDEAVDQMELLGHDFFVFRDAETHGIQVVYRRHDGDYGLIVPHDEE